jgi:thiol-disulfide isomerase/thioredoxin
MKAPFLAALLLSFFALPAFAKTTTPVGARSVSAPRFSLPTRQGTVSLDSLRGKVVLIDFWASWCEPCRRSFPWMSALYDRYAPKGFDIVAIDLDKSRDAAEAFLGEFHAPFQVAFDPSGKTAEAFKVSAMPSSFLVDRTGAILYAHAGFDPKKTEPLEALVKEACSP